MDPEFSRLVDEAADIAASGRWAAVNERILHLLANPGEDNAWWVQLFASLCSQIFSEYLSLKRAYESKQPDAALLAWRARNLLELFVWSIYCAKTKENARRVFEDARRDVRDIYDAFIRWCAATGQAPNWVDPFRAAKQDLSQQALVVEGIKSLEGSYKKVSDSASECGISGQFSLNYKMLSKFAHPTAMQILASPEREYAALLMDNFFGLGCLFFAIAFRALESQLQLQ